jgi:uncharacterized protein DUF3551
MMLLLFAGIVTAAVLIGGRAGAQNYPWCANFADGAGTNCGFSTLEQCMITAQGSGGYCDRNTQFKPSATTAPAPASRKARKSAARLGPLAHSLEGPR